MKVLNDAGELLAYVETLFDYEAGFRDGATDANLVSQPKDTNGHTLPAFLEVRERAARCYARVEDDGADAPPYFAGYCDAADEVALCKRGGRRLALQLKGV